LKCTCAFLLPGAVLENDTLGFILPLFSTIFGDKISRKKNPPTIELLDSYDVLLSLKYFFRTVPEYFMYKAMKVIQAASDSSLFRAQLVKERSCLSVTGASWSW